MLIVPVTGKINRRNLPFVTIGLILINCLVFYFFQLNDDRRADEAIATCRQALTRYPDDVNILGLLGAALGDQGKFAEAEEILLRVIDLTPTFAKPYEDLGTLVLQQGQAERAIPLLEKAIRLDPK